MMAKAKFVLRALGMALVALLTCAGCERASRRSVGLLGSTSIQPFAELLAEQYMKKSPGQLVEVQGGGSTAGLQGAANGLADIGMCSRSLTQQESEQFTPILIARDLP